MRSGGLQNRLFVHPHIKEHLLFKFPGLLVLQLAQLQSKGVHWSVYRVKLMNMSTLVKESKPLSRLSKPLVLNVYVVICPISSCLGWGRLPTGLTPMCLHLCQLLQQML